MSETEIEEYIIDTKEGKGHFTLRVSLFDERVKLLITAVERPNKKYYNLVRLSQLKEACVAFDKVSTIKDALIILKNNIESGNILISEENQDVIDVKFVLKIKGKTYPPFFIGLPIDNDPEPENNKIENTPQKNEEKNNYEVLPTTFDYQGNKEAELKYGKSTKSTTEYVKPIIQSDVKEPNLILEYIEPILQVHYPDGTTKSTALPARLQTEDGKEPNIAPEQLKSIHEQISQNFNQSLMDYEKEKSRANSVSRKNPSSDFSRQTVNVHNFTNINNLNNLNNLTPNLKTFENINANSQDINAVRSAMKPNINMNINMNMNTLNNYNIRQVRTQFNPYDNMDERKTTGSVNNLNANINNIMNNMPLSTRNNVINLNGLQQNKLINKGLSDYSISSMPNKPLVVPNNYNYGMIPNTTVKNSQSNNNSPLIQEVPKFLNQNQNINTSNYNNIIMLQKGLNKSSSSPSMQTLGKVNHNFYQQNQGQTEYFFRQNNNNINYNNFPLTQSYQNLQNQINNVNLQMNNNMNMNKINSAHTNFMNYTHNPHLVKNNQNYTFNNNNVSQNVLSRNYSNQNTFANYRQMDPMNQINNPLLQSSDDIRYQQLLNQRRLQEQQRLQILQRTKMNNLNYNALNNPNLNNMNNMNMLYNNVSRNPHLTNNNPQISSNTKNSQQINYAEVNILEQQIKARNRPQNVKNTEPMNNLRNRNTNINININQNKPLKTINIDQPSLKQSRSQQVIRQSPSMKNEITEQQIAFAQMASLQNQQNPNNLKANFVSLNQKYLDLNGNEETQSQFERESNNTQPQVIMPTLKIERENTNKKVGNSEGGPATEKKINSENNSQYSPQTPRNKPSDKISQTPQKAEDDDVEDPEAERLFKLPNKLIIFRNGLLRGIIHKYKEIDDVVSKIQLKLMAGAKFMLLYRASTDGDKAKIFHQKCDNHNMTLVLVETTKGVRFGGFTMKSWDGNCAKKIDNEAFVFSFDKRKCYDIVKNEHAIGAYPKFGPVFFGCQIRIYDDFFTKGGTTCNRGLNYKTKEDYELNNGEQKYIVKEIEVYAIEVIQV